MPDLKDLSWSVQESVEPLPFDQLERRAVLRRRRRHVIAGIGAAAATAAAVLVVILPSNQTGQAPVAPEPTKPVQFWPTPSPPKADAGAAEALIATPGAQLGSVLMATPTNWAAAWSNCAPKPCRYSAVVKRGAVRAVAPVRERGYAVVQAGDEAIALAGPGGISLTPDDRTWAQTVMVRLTDRGLIETKLLFAKSTKTFGDGEILTTAGTGELLVLNLEKSTLRRLEMPAGFATSTSPVRDGTGRWWVVGTEGFSSDIGWTDDGGATWKQTTLDLDSKGSTVAVSADGRTVLATSWVDGATLEAIGKLRMSTDAGAHWQTVQIPRLARGGGPVAFNDGTARMIGIANGGTTALYGIDSSGTMTKLPGLPDLLDDLSGDGKLLYGPLLQGSTQELMRGPSQNKVATSTDRGQSWQQFVPR